MDLVPTAVDFLNDRPSDKELSGYADDMVKLEYKLRAKLSMGKENSDTSTMQPVMCVEDDAGPMRGRDFAKQMFSSGEMDDAIESIKCQLREFIEALQSDELAEFNRAWEVKFGEAYPKDIDAWTRLAARAGVSADFLINSPWKIGDVVPIIEGYLQRLLDQREIDATPTADAMERESKKQWTAEWNNVPTVDISHWPSKTQAAKQMEISVRELTKWITDGEVKAYKLGKEHKIDMVSLESAHARHYPDA